MKKHCKWLSGALLVLALAACSEENQKQGKEAEEVHDHEEENNDNVSNEEHGEGTGSHVQEDEHEQFTRFIATSENGIHVFNNKFEEMKKFEFANASLSQVGSSPYVFAKNIEQNSTYQFLHAGVWVEDHADHVHPYTEDAVLFDASLEGNKPAHVVSFNDQIAVFNDGDGSVQVYSAGANKPDEPPAPTYSYQGIAHHGVAIPLANNELAVSYPAKEGDALPTGVKIVNEKGEEQAIITSACEQLHGAAYGGNTLAFGCVGGVVLYDVETKETKEIKLKDSGSRVGTFKFAADSDYFLSNYSIGKEPSKEVGIINRQTGDMQYVTLPAAYKSALLATKDKGYALTEDGYIYEIDFASAKISSKIHAFNAFDLAEESPSLHGVNGHIFIVMPSYEKVYEVHGNHTHEVAKLDFVPTSFIVK